MATIGARTERPALDTAMAALPARATIVHEIMVHEIMGRQVRIKPVFLRTRARTTRIGAASKATVPDRLASSNENAAWKRREYNPAHRRYNAIIGTGTNQARWASLIKNAAIKRRECSRTLLPYVSEIDGATFAPAPRARVTIGPVVFARTRFSPRQG